MIRVCFCSFFFLLSSLYVNVNANSVAQSDQKTVKQISIQDASQALKNKKAVLIDVRSGSEYDEKSIPNAILIEKDKLIKNYDLYKSLIGDKDIILHCKTGVRGSNTAEALQKIVKNNVYNLQGGISAWEMNGMPVIKSGISIMRQVQIAVGIVTLIFALLGFFKNKKFLIVNIIVACGLMFAGVTGFCGLARLIKMMPWN